MNPSAVLRSERLGPLTRLMAAWGVWAALGLASAAPLQAQAGGITPAGTVVSNVASATYETANGSSITSTGSVDFVVGQVAGVDVDPPRIAISDAGRDVVFAHRIDNVGNGSDAFGAVAFSPSGWPTSVYHDVDGDGLLTASDTIMSGALDVAFAATGRILVVVSVPASATLGTTENVTVTATSQFDGAVSDAVVNEIRLIDPGVDPEIDKSVDLTLAAPDDLLTYSLRVRLVGAGARDSVFFSDPLPLFTNYESGTIQVDGVSLTDAVDGDAGSYDAGTGTVRVDLSALPSDTDTNIEFQVRIDAAAPVGTQINNQGVVDVFTPSGLLTEQSLPAQTVIAAPALQITKTVAGFDPAAAGDTLTYTIEVTNPNTSLAATNLTVVDTLPAELVFESASPTATISGSELSWNIARIDPGQTATIDIVAVVGAVVDTVAVANTAHLIRAGATGEMAVSPSVTVMPAVQASLDLALDAEVVEIGLGEALPLQTTLLNDGPATVTEIIVRIALPIGTDFIDEGVLAAAFNSDRPAPAFVVPPSGPALAPPANFVESALQLDSFAVANDTLTVWLPGELRPQESIRFRYELMVNSAPDGVIINEAIAEARRGNLQAASAVAVASNQAQSLVALARNRALETRTVIGKVFHDINGDGFQDLNEPGVPRVDIVSADGELVTTDAFGKFSLNNLRPGRHALRIDPISLPEGLEARRSGVGERLQVVEVNGWNSPRVSFAVDGEPVVPLTPMDEVEVEERLDPDDDMDVALILPTDSTARRVAIQRANAEEAEGVVGLPPVELIEGAIPMTAAADSAAAVAARAAGAAVESPDSVLLSQPEAADSSAAPAALPAPIRIAPLRSEADRDADARNAFLTGPAIRTLDPVDGLVSPTNRVYIGVEGEPMRPVSLYRDGELVAEATLLPNGIGDFVGVELQPGPQTFRVRTVNSWGNEVWDSLVVHQSGAPVQLTPDRESVTVVADGRTPATARVRLLDAWGVPVTNRPYVTVHMNEGRFLGRDVDPTSVGHQLQADADGWVEIELVGGRTVGEASLLIEAPDADVVLPLRVIAPVRPLFVTGVGQVTLGSGGEGFGAVTAQGRLTDEAAITLSYDTRRLDQGRDVFGRNFDPLEEGQQPILGDASTQRSLSASRYQFSARVDRGLDWFMFGDVQTSGFSDGMSLARYGRSLPGAAARVTTGAVVWNAFGAATTQALQQQQFRGEGSSGPFELGRGVLPGTEEVRIEIRALENPTRVMSEKRLTRYAEYQIDYTRGTLLLKQPVPAADPFGNPIFLLVSYEGESGGDRSGVWGVRASSELEVGPLTEAIPVSASFVNDSRPGQSFRLGAFQTGVAAENGLRLDAELAMASGSDSSGVATRLKGLAPLFDDRIQLTAEWSKIGDEFSNPGNIALRPGTSELRAAASGDVAGGRVTAAHERQDFSTRDLNRRRTTVGYAQEVIEDVSIEARLAGDATTTATDTTSSGAGEYKVTWSATERLDVFGQARSELWSNGTGLANRGSYYGAGGTYALSDRFSVEARHLRVTPADGANPYGLTSIGLQSSLRSGTNAWGGYEITGGIDGQRNAAVVGLNHQFNIGTDWRFSSMLERRNGVAGATLGDPVLASPFDQPEGNYTSVSFGTEYIPQAKPYRASLRAEDRSGNLSSTRLATLAGDIAFSGDLALLSRQEFIERDQFGAVSTSYTRERSSLWGLAYRPTQRDDLNLLFKFGWKDAINPFGTGVLASEGEESRLIGALEAIWAPMPEVEFGGRFATRSTRLGVPLTSATTLITRNQTDFIGVRGRWYAHPMVGVELEARGLMSELSPGAIWDVSPSLVGRPLQEIEVELGYRFGDLQDPDFAVRSGKGLFLTIGTRFTEDLVGSAADFWRSRFGGGE